MGYDMQEIKEIFSDAKKAKTVQQEEEIKLFISELDGFRFTDDSSLSDSDKSIVYYVAGYIAKSAVSECDNCNEFVSPGKVPMSVTFDSEENDSEESIILAKEAFVSAVSRGGLLRPSDAMYLAAVNATLLYRYISKDNELMKSLLETINPRDTFVDAYMTVTASDNTALTILKMKCKNEHQFSKYLRRTAFTIFNISAKNYAAKLNDVIRTDKAAKTTENAKKSLQKRNKAAMKIAKLQSDKL